MKAPSCALYCNRRILMLHILYSATMVLHIHTALQHSSLHQYCLYCCKARGSLCCWMLQASFYYYFTTQNFSYNGKILVRMAKVGWIVKGDGREKLISLMSYSERQWLLYGVSGPPVYHFLLSLWHNISQQLLATTSFNNILFGGKVWAEEYWASQKSRSVVVVFYFLHLLMKYFHFLIGSHCVLHRKQFFTAFTVHQV